MIAWFKKLYQPINDFDAAQAELREAYLELLTAQTAVDYATSVVSYNKTRIARLEAYVGEKK